MASNNLKIKFIMKVATVLHRYGASSDRIEAAMVQLAEKLNIKADFFSLPTSFMGNFKFSEEEEYTRMLRLDPGKINLEKLYLADRTVDDVIDEKLELEKGIDFLDDVINRDNKHSVMAVNFSIMLLACSIAVVLGGGIFDSLISGGLGLLSGLMSSSVKLERLDTIREGFLCFIIGFIATASSVWIEGVNSQLIILASIIYYIPGLSLTMAMGEISSQNLTAGTARLAGAIVILLKIGFGTFLGTSLAHKLYEINVVSPDPILNILLIIPALILVGLSFVVSFQARWQETPWIIFACASTYGMHVFMKQELGSLTGTLIAGIYLGMMSNGYSRVFNRPSMIVSLPAIIMLVPGSVGFKGFEFLFSNQTVSGINSLFNTFILGLALVAGTYFGNILIKPRRFI